MKRIYLLLMLLTLAVTAFAQDGKSLYNKYSERDAVQAVYISPAMFRLIGRLPDMQVGGSSLDLETLVKNMSGFYLLTIEKKAVADELAKDVQQFVTKGRYELLMEAKESGEVSQIYTIGDDATIRSFVLFTRDDEEATFLSMDGEIPREALEQVLMQ